MYKEKYNNVACIMQSLKEQAHCSVRELSTYLSYSPNTICGMMHGESHALSLYIALALYFLQEANWKLDLSEVPEMIDYAFGHNMPLVIGAYDHKQKKVVEYRFFIMKNELD